MNKEYIGSSFDNFLEEDWEVVDISECGIIVPYSTEQ
jgi:hypothetical protein